MSRAPARGAGAPGADRDALAAAVAVALARGLDAAGWPLDAAARAKLVDYVVLLARWNRAYNLTAVRDPLEMVPRHLLDSLSLLPRLAGAARLLDVGTGAGLPGIPLAIAAPGLRCTLLDANAKKTRFCIQAAGELGLAGVAVEHARLEAFAPGPTFDLVVSRATLALPALVAGARPLLVPGGRVLAMKGEVPEAEIAGLDPGDAVEVEPVTVPGLDARRHFVTVRPAMA